MIDGPTLWWNVGPPISTAEALESVQGHVSAQGYMASTSYELHCGLSERTEKVISGPTLWWNVGPPISTAAALELVQGHVSAQGYMASTSYE